LLAAKSKRYEVALVTSDQEKIGCSGSVDEPFMGDSCSGEAKLGHAAGDDGLAVSIAAFATIRVSLSTASPSGAAIFKTSDKPADEPGTVIDS